MNNKQPTIEIYGINIPLTRMYEIEISVQKEQINL